MVVNKLKIRTNRFFGSISIWIERKEQESLTVRVGFNIPVKTIE
jgi:hypothetical protein